MSDCAIARITRKSIFRVPLIEDNMEFPAAILCSSGTTGLSKGVQLSHYQCMKFLDASTIKSGLVFSSLYWLSGFVSLSSGLYNGAKRVITHQSFSPEAFFSLVEQYEVEFVIAAPTHAGIKLISCL